MELKNLIEKYQNELNNLEIEFQTFINEFPYLDLESDIIPQLNKEILQKIEQLVLKLNLPYTKEFITSLLNYYYLNKDLNFNNLIIKDENLERFINSIKDIYLKLEAYKNDKTKEYQLKKEKYTNIITNLENIINLLNQETEIDINNLIDLLKTLPLDKETILEILKSALETNLIFYNDIKDGMELKQTLDVEINKDEYTEIIETYIKKIEYYLNKVKKDGNYSEQKYTYQSNLVKLLKLLEEEKEYYNLCLGDSKYSEELIEVRKTILNIIDLVDSEIDSYEDSTKSEEIDFQNGRDLIIIAPAVRDLDQFKKSVCSLNNIKDLYKMLKKLKNEEIVYGMPVQAIDSQIPVKKLKVSSSIGGTPRLFYQMIGNKAIVLMLGIEGRKDYTFFKQSINGRVKSGEYNILINAIRLGTTTPLEKSPYDNKVSNQEYLDNLLTYYKQCESDFFTTFYNECYNPDPNMR